MPAGSQRQDLVPVDIISGVPYYVYICTNRLNTVLYTGVTRDLVRRMEEHKLGVGSAFASKYRVDRLVYYEVADEVESGIEREKRIKGGSRKRKMDLIDAFNPTWRDLSYEL